ncbi:MAG: protein-export chaperone SecB, partial [Sphingomicrobium sp.]
FMLIEAPRLIFPFARQVISEAVSSAGFPPLLLDPIDFGAAYMAQLQAAQEAEQKSDGEESAETPAPTDTPTDA